MSFARDIAGKNILVFGLGLQGGGVGDALWLHGKGATVRVTDAKSVSELAVSLAKLPAGISKTIGGHDEKDIKWADIIIKNPGVPDNHPLLNHANKLGKPVMTSIAIFVREFRDHVIGVTGTRGKSTTTEMIFNLMESETPGRIIRGGNIPGTSGLSLIDRIAVSDWAVLELSSFQLHNFHDLKISPHIAVVTNIYPDHLNRYQGMDEYINDKKAIAAYQNPGDIVIYNAANDGAYAIAQTSSGTQIGFKSADLPASWPFSLPGEHNKENASAVIQLSQELKINQEHVKDIITNFHGLPFRLENRGTKNGITYINDTTSTTPTSTIKAITAMSRPTVLILGGQSKGLPLESLMKNIKDNTIIRKIIILGSDGFVDFLEAVHRVAGDKIVGVAHSMQEATRLATQVAEVGWNVLLSPGFASFDLFENEFDRGRQFNQFVDALDG